MSGTLRRVPSGWTGERNERGEAEGRVAVSDFEAGGMRYIFVRLAEVGSEEKSIHSFQSEATVDLDADGNVMGVMVAWMEEANPAVGIKARPEEVPSRHDEHDDRDEH